MPWIPEFRFPRMWHDNGIYSCVHSQPLNIEAMFHEDIIIDPKLMDSSVDLYSMSLLMLYYISLTDTNWTRHS